ncbi:hypothetical protein LPJ63_003122, partial [Coemansia sp. RSA 2711]
MTTVKAEFRDATQATDPFTIECAADDAAGLVGALESMQSQINAKLTSLLDAEKSASSTTS